jgi:hypothetical protein
MSTENGSLDVQSLIGAVAARHGILLKSDDAAFALVTINQLMLEEVMKRMLVKVEATVADFEQAASRVQAQAGGLLAIEVKNAAAAVRGELESDIASAGREAREFVLEVHRAHSRAALEKWVAVGLISALSLFVCGVFVGRMFQ